MISFIQMCFFLLPNHIFNYPFGLRWELCPCSLTSRISNVVSNSCQKVEFKWLTRHWIVRDKRRKNKANRIRECWQSYARSYRHIILCKLHNILLQVDHERAMVADKHNLKGADIHIDTKSNPEIIPSILTEAALLKRRSSRYTGRSNCHEGTQQIEHLS